MDKTFTILPNELDLAGDWGLETTDGRFPSRYQVPGDIHSALLAAGHIPDPYKGQNELKVRWVADESWVARRTFLVTKVENGAYYLDVTYLDTVAEIYLNEELVLKAENCFRRYRPDVTAQLRDGENAIEILFKSNTAAANERQALQPFYIPYSTNNCPIPNGNMLRKPACHFGWDWNLAIVPFGLYGQITLGHASNFRVEHIIAHQNHSAGDTTITVDIDVMLHGRGAADIEVVFAGETKSRRIDHTFGDTKQRFRFKVVDPKLWWPAGHGAQTLYDIAVTCDGKTTTHSIGLRKVELITAKDDAGSRFAFRVNEREIFCRGANWIPADALPSRATPELTRKLLQSAKDANMNMVRVWGGGYYEQDFFYDLCDELGLMVWQDFMFACNLYPSTPDFLREVKSEVDYQVRRLQHHACIILWCGDNELIGALTWFKESRENRDRYLVNYDRLNRLIEETMHLADPNGVWWPSSPSSGILDFGDAWHNDGKGDMHFWSVWHEGKDFDHYRDVKPRFCSEFGFQSFPGMQIVRDFIDHDVDLNIASNVMEHHQRNAGGNARIAETMFRYFRFPMDFGNFVYLSQIQQGLAIKTAVEYWRSLKPHCMGTLYWQLNDTWPVASWSSLNHGGDWKALHFMARRFFAPLAVVLIPDKESGDFVIIGVNDTSSATSIETDIFASTPEGQTTRLKRLVSQLSPDHATEITRIPSSQVPDGNFICWSWHNIGGARGRGHFSPVPYKSLALVNPGIEVTTTTEESAVMVRLQAQKPALFVTLETGVPGRFSENVFDIMAGEIIDLKFTPDNPSDLGTAIQTLIIRDLYASSH